MTLPLYSNAGFIQPLEIREGAKFSIELSFFAEEVDGEPYDLTGAEVRARVTSLVPGSALTYDFTFVNDTPELGVISGTMSGALTGTMIPSPTSRLRDPDHKWECDVKLADGTIVPFCRGPVTVVAGAIPW